MIIKNFNPFVGIHCETTATGCLLKQLDIELSEPMMFGLGEGLGFIFWNMKLMDFPFIGGRVKPLALSESLAKNLNLTLEIKETASVKKAWSNVKHYSENDNSRGSKCREVLSCSRWCKKWKKGLGECPRGVIYHYL